MGVGGTVAEGLRHLTPSASLVAVVKAVAKMFKYFVANATLFFFFFFHRLRRVHLHTVILLGACVVVWT